MLKSSARTDLASEAGARLDTLPDGVISDTFTLCGSNVSSVIISTPDAAEALGKPMGRYLTLEMVNYVSRREPDFSSCAEALREILLSFPAVERGQSFLIACLGNRAVTPDAVGPCAADGILVTRHLKASLPQDFAVFSSVSVLRTGVLGTTGIESAQAIKSACSVVEPDCVIVIDALASGEAARLCRSVQICDTGISPGSGVGNDRAAVNEELLGCPVIAVGVPTVTDASALTDDASAERLFVTPRNIDELVRAAAKLIAYGINLALHRGLDIADIDALTD